MTSLTPGTQSLVNEEPWLRSELRQVVVLSAVGLIALLVGWWNVRDAGSFDQQKGWLVQAILAVAIVGIVLVRWLAALMRRTKQVQRALTIVLAERHGLLPPRPVTLAGRRGGGARLR